MGYLDDALGVRETPQSEPIPGSTQVANNAGGFAWAVDDWTRMRRFLILGSEGGTHYQGERELTKSNIAASLRCLNADGERFVNELVDVSLKGAAKKVDPTIFLLAAACASNDLAVRRMAFRSIKVVCRTGTHILTFCRYVEQFRGWGRGLRAAVADWYYQPTDKLAYQLVKYRQRDGWSHRDVLRLTHPKTKDLGLENVWRFALGAEMSDVRVVNMGVLPQEPMIEAFQRAQQAKSPKETAALVREYRLPREALLSEHLTSPEVWAALLEVGMPVGALVRNLGNMAKAGILGQMSAGAATVIRRLASAEDIGRSRLHPLAILAAMLTYGQGHGMRSSATWPVNGQIVDALDAAFYLAFGNVEPTGKRTMLALDVSGSMGMGDLGGVPGLTPRMAAAAMALVTANVEPSYGFYGFSTTFVELDITPKMRLNEAMARTQLPFQGTDCALPMIYAASKAIEVDTFVVYTDNETWAGRIHPKQALDTYRRWRPEARCAVVGMTSGGFSIADPNDRGMMDLVGFDTGTPETLRAFAMGEI